VNAAFAPYGLYFLTTLFVIVELVVVMASPAIAVSQTPLNLAKGVFPGTQSRRNADESF
jgi:hypothetical protein